MATDPNEEKKLFKQYLIETNAFQSLVQILSMLHNTNPKPENAMQFIRKRLDQTESIDADEFHCMKQCLSKLNEDVSQMKADMTKISNLVSKLLPDDISANNEIDPSVNMSVPSMENNAGDGSQITMLDDSSLIYDQTVINSTVDLNATMQTDDSNYEQQSNGTHIDALNVSQSKDDNSVGSGFIMEIVEVDVVNKSMSNSSLINYTTENQENEKVIEEMQVDEIAPESVTVTSTPIKCEHMANANGSNMDIKIEDLPIIFKDDSSLEQLTLSQGFCGFNSQDVQESEKHLPNVRQPEEHLSTDDMKAPQEDFDSCTEPKTEQQPRSEVALAEIEQSNESQVVKGIVDVDVSENEPDAGNNSFGKLAMIVEEMEEVGENGNIAEADKTINGSIENKVSVNENEKVPEAVADTGHTATEAVTTTVLTETEVMEPEPLGQTHIESIAQCTSAEKSAFKCIAMPKDDPETLFLLSCS
ncbi:uncharacterized protein LOC116349336 isoform X2 [Contarinia nasturtii]|uniref:uncharacterized protein LOC116349336 isoform X2 n=1 Tax=Contarinia nasturtii TaxID=265458 RepID=UPI0012D4B7A0|nr:uncharacterized protein LOC116349336 isoform X2 [Contarinia nasturtii]